MIVQRPDLRISFFSAQPPCHYLPRARPFVDWFNVGGTINDINFVGTIYCNTMLSGLSLNQKPPTDRQHHQRKNLRLYRLLIPTYNSVNSPQQVPPAYFNIFLHLPDFFKGRRSYLLPLDTELRILVLNHTAELSSGKELSVCMAQRM